MFTLKERGYSLVEVMVAVSLLSAVLIPIVLILSSSATSMSASSNRSVASNLAQEKMEELRNTLYDSIVNATDSKTVNRVTFTRETSVMVAPPELGVATDASVKKITITVSWQEDGKIRSISLVTIRSNQVKV